MRIPVNVVSGESGAARAALIARLCAQRSDWVGLVEVPPSGATANVKALSAGCPCCIGKVVLQVTLARALRQSGAVRAFVELADPEHMANFERVLAENPLGFSVRRSRPIVLPADTALQAESLSD